MRRRLPSLLSFLSSGPQSPCHGCSREPSRCRIRGIVAGRGGGRPRIIPLSAVLLPDVVLLRSASAGAGCFLCRLVASEGLVIAVSFERSAPHLGVAMVSPVESNAGPCGTRRAFMVTGIRAAADRGAAGRSRPEFPAARPCASPCHCQAMPDSDRAWNRPCDGPATGAGGPTGAPRRPRPRQGAA